MAFLMIEIDESERDFTRFFWDENPGVDLENKRLDIFRMTRVLFGVKSSPFFLAATIKHHLKKYVDIFPDTFNHLNPLTPGHFLTNCAISSFPEPYTASDSLSYHSRWKLIQSLRDKFWNRWSTEYLTHLQTRAKWSIQNPNLMENQLVLLKDPNTKPLDWSMGRIKVFPGSDGLVRVVNVKTSTGILKRAITFTYSS
ncbi:integrase catalytic domain-containing protein [Trichonephila clavipes]|nr:integrase catalytic domain-containing protein [Trichonephila clavipes]